MDFFVLKTYYLNDSAKREVDFRSDWALSWGRPMSRFTRYARSRVSSVTLIPEESPSLHSNQHIHMTYVLQNVIQLLSFIGTLLRFIAQPYSNQPFHLEHIFSFISNNCFLCESGVSATTDVQSLSLL